MWPEITASPFIVPCDSPLSVRLTANRKILLGRKDLQKSATRSVAADYVSHMTRAAATRTGFLNKCRDPKIDELRLGWLGPQQAHSARPSIQHRARRPHSRSQSLISNPFAWASAGTSARIASGAKSAPFGQQTVLQTGSTTHIAKAFASSNGSKTGPQSSGRRSTWAEQPSLKRTNSDVGPVTSA